MTDPRLPQLPSTRRDVLVGIAGAALLGLPASPLHARSLVQNAVFRHGVASGDPDATSVVLWTRVTSETPVAVDWELAEDAAFARPIAQGQVWTGPERDWTVKVLAQGLQPGATCYYRFHCKNAFSAVGRTRTLPTGSLARLGIALASCSNYAFGFFNAYDAIARDRRVDYVLHTGDYIYEHGGGEWGSDVARKIGRVHQPANEIVTLADYRMRHAQYKTDAGARAMHAAHPMLACWDDHESANNPWKDGAQNHQPDMEGRWDDRRAASIRAYYEWMPVREPVPGRSRMQFWRSYRFGDLATLCTLETRHTARAKQVDYMAYKDSIASMADARRMEAEQIDVPGRPLIASELEGDLDLALRRSVQDHQPWRLIGNPMPIARTRVPDVVGMGLLPDPFASAGSSDSARILAWKGKWNLPFYTDTWDGYEWARQRFYDRARDAGASDLIFLSGDSHSFWANRLSDSAGRRTGVELGTAGISSPGDFIDSGFDRVLALKLDRAFEAHNPEVQWTDNMHQGYVRLDLGHDRGEASFVAVDTVTSLQYRTHTLRRFALARSKGSLDLLPVQA